MLYCIQPRVYDTRETGSGSRVCLVREIFTDADFGQVEEAKRTSLKAHGMNLSMYVG